MYIPARGSGGFGGKKPGDHTFAGPPAASFVGSVNSDIEDGRIRKDAPPAQLYDLNVDPSQTRNVHDEFPEVVKELSELLASYAPEARSEPKTKAGTGTLPKIPRQPRSGRSASFDFESGRLEPWKVVDGEFGHIIGNRSDFFHGTRRVQQAGRILFDDAGVDRRCATRGSTSKPV